MYVRQRQRQRQREIEGDAVRQRPGPQYLGRNIEKGWESCGCCGIFCRKFYWHLFVMTSDFLSSWNCSKNIPRFTNFSHRDCISSGEFSMQDSEGLLDAGRMHKILHIISGHLRVSRATFQNCSCYYYHRNNEGEIKGEQNESAGGMILPSAVDLGDRCTQRLCPAMGSYCTANTALTGHLGTLWR